MREYYVTITYLATVTAENESDATAITQKWIAEGDLYPADIEVEEK